MDSVSFRYSHALFQLAVELNSISPWQAYMKQIHQLLLSEHELVNLLKHSEFPSQAKKDLLQKIFKDAPLEILHFMMLLVDRKRIQYLETIAVDFHHECNEYLGIKEGMIYSAISLPIRSIREIEEKISNVLKQKVELHVELDMSLIGGFKVVIGDRVYDNTLTHQLQELRQTMMEGKR